MKPHRCAICHRSVGKPHELFCPNRSHFGVKKPKDGKS